MVFQARVESVIRPSFFLRIHPLRRFIPNFLPPLFFISSLGRDVESLRRRSKKKKKKKEEEVDIAWWFTEIADSFKVNYSRTIQFRIFFQYRLKIIYSFIKSFDFHENISFLNFIITDARLTTDVISFYNAISGHEKLLSGLKGIWTRAVCK